MYILYRSLDYTFQKPTLCVFVKKDRNTGQDRRLIRLVNRVTIRYNIFVGVELMVFAGDRVSNSNASPIGWQNYWKRNK